MALVPLPPIFFQLTIAVAASTVGKHIVFADLAGYCKIFQLFGKVVNHSHISTAAYVLKRQTVLDARRRGYLVCIIIEDVVNRSRTDGWVIAPNFTITSGKMLIMPGLRSLLCLFNLHRSSV